MTPRESTLQGITEVQGIGRSARVDFSGSVTTFWSLSGEGLKNSCIQQTPGIGDKEMTALENLQINGRIMRKKSSKKR